MDKRKETLEFINTRTAEQLDEIAARLIEELVEKNDRLRREVNFLRDLMASYVAKHEQLAGARPR